MSEAAAISAAERPTGTEATDLLAASLREARSRAPLGAAPGDVDRSAAIAFLEATGFPTAADEAWRFTPVRAITRTPYWLPLPGDVPPVSTRRDGIVLVNGSPDLGDSAATNLGVRTLRDTSSSEPERVSEHLGRIVSLENGFIAQNAALFEDGIVIVARRGTRTTVRLVHLAVPASGPTLSTPRVLVIGEPDSELVLTESHESVDGAAHFENSVTELALGENSRVEHVRVHHGAPHAGAVGTISVRQERNSRYHSRVFTFGGALARVDIRVKLEGPGAECTLDGLYLARGGELVDHHTVIDHAEPHCSSRERYKGILDGTAVAVFDGTVFVRRGADGTVAHQENRNLCLSNDCIIHTKPHLEIDTDDVKCSHGATVGKLDPAQLFYLRSRGMDATVARALLTYAFAREMAASLPDPALREQVESAIAARVPGGDAARELA